MTLFEHFESLVGKVSRIISLIGLAGLLALAFATVLDVLLRWLASRPITGVRDLSSLFIAVVIAASFPICISEQKNITIRFLGTALGPFYRKILDLFGNIITFVILTLMSWQLWLYAAELARSHETTWVLGLPVSPWYRGVAALISFCVIAELVVIFKIIQTPTVKEENDPSKDKPGPLDEGAID